MRVDGCVMKTTNFNIKCTLAVIYFKYHHSIKVINYRSQIRTLDFNNIKIIYMLEYAFEVDYYILQKYFGICIRCRKLHCTKIILSRVN
jgi:hypothetical protein